jgi:hypothetical protein
MSKSAIEVPSVSTGRSVNISLKSVSDSAMISLVDKLVSERSDSVQITLRSEASAFVSLIGRLGERAGSVSAVLTLKGRSPAR